MKVRTDAQLLLAMRAPPRPDLGAADKSRKRTLQCEWVASWEGRPLAAGASDAQQSAWWKQAKKQHGELVDDHWLGRVQWCDHRDAFRRGPRGGNHWQWERRPALLVSGLSDLEQKAALAEAWADAFETRWGQERAAAAGVRDAVLRTRSNVEQIAQVRDEMESVAREEKISLKV
jgi:hypothetical protein